MHTTIHRTPNQTILLFIDGADKWTGPWPGMSWDTLYDKYIPKYKSLSEYRTKVPTIIIGPKTDYCRPIILKSNQHEYFNLILERRFRDAREHIAKEQCDNLTEYQHCSFECWYLSEKQLLINENRPLKLFELTFKSLCNRWDQYINK